MSIPSLAATTRLCDIAEALDEAGCVVVTDALAPASCDAIRRELEPHMAAARVIDEDDPTEFYPGRTRRVTALVTRSETVTDQLVAHPISTAICDRFLLPNGE